MRYLFILILFAALGCEKEKGPNVELVEKPKYNSKVVRWNPTIFELEYKGCLYLHMSSGSGGITHQANCTNHKGGSDE